jgi:hypothetical protein
MVTLRQHCSPNSTARASLDPAVLDLALVLECTTGATGRLAPVHSPYLDHPFDSEQCSWADCARNEDEGWPYSDDEH